MTSENRFRVVFGVSAFLSVASIPIAIYCTGRAADAGRGGALAFALSLAIMFLSRSYGTRVYNALTEDAEQIEADLATITNAKREPTSDIRGQVMALSNKARIDAAAQSLQNKYLAWSTGIGTLAWGFGDLVAERFMQAPPPV